MLYMWCKFRPFFPLSLGLLFLLFINGVDEGTLSHPKSYCSDEQFSSRTISLYQSDKFYFVGFYLSQKFPVCSCL